MNSYLSKKYGQDFVTDNVRSTSGTVGITSTFKATSHPASNPSLIFTISRTDNKNSSYQDTFLETLWSKEGKTKVENFITSQLSEISDYQLTIAPSNRLYSSINGSAPDLATIQSNNAGEYTYSLIVHSSSLASTNEPTSVELQRAFSLVNFVKAQKAGWASLSYFYNEPGFNKKDAISGESLYEYRIYVTGQDLQKIFSANQLEQYFKKIN